MCYTMAYNMCNAIKEVSNSYKELMMNVKKNITLTLYTGDWQITCIEWRPKFRCNVYLTLRTLQRVSMLYFMQHYLPLRMHGEAISGHVCGPLTLRIHCDAMFETL